MAGSAPARPVQDVAKSICCALVRIEKCKGGAALRHLFLPEVLIEIRRGREHPDDGPIPSACSPESPPATLHRRSQLEWAHIQGVVVWERRADAPAHLSFELMGDATCAQVSLQRPPAPVAGQCPELLVGQPLLHRHERIVPPRRTGRRGPSRQAAHVNRRRRRTATPGATGQVVAGACGVRFSPGPRRRHQLSLIAYAACLGAVRMVVPGRLSATGHPGGGNARGHQRSLDAQLRLGPRLEPRAASLL